MAKTHWIVAVLLLGQAHPADATLTLLDPAKVSVTVQGTPGLSVPGFLMRGDTFVTVGDLRRLGRIQLPDGLSATSQELVPLSRIPGIGWARASAGQVTISLRPENGTSGMLTLRLDLDQTIQGEVRAVLHLGELSLFAADLRRLGIDPGPSAQRLVPWQLLPYAGVIVDSLAGRIHLTTSVVARPGPTPLPEVSHSNGTAVRLDPVPLPSARQGRSAPRRVARSEGGLPIQAAHLPIAGLGGDSRQAGASEVRPADETLALLVRLNGGAPRFILRSIRRGDRLLVRRVDLTQLRIRAPAGPEQFMDLGDMPDVGWRLLEAEQILELDVPAALLIPDVLDVAGQQRLPVSPAATGAILTYDVEGQRRIGGALDGRLAAYGFFGANAFSPLGSVTMSAIGRTGDRAVIPDQGFIRLDTTMQVDDPDRAWTYRLGDVVTGAGENRRRIRLGGAQWATDYLTRPDLVTYPRPFISGSAAVPSTVDLLINGVRTFSSPVGAGPFELREIPALVGPNAMSITVRDAQGLVSTRLVEINTSRRLLAQGMVEHSVEAGAIRRRYGFSSNDYGRPAGSGFVRYGVSDRVTLSSRLEGTDDFALAGLGGVVSLGPAGSLSFEPAAAIRRGRGTGFELAGRWEVSRQGYSASVGASTALGDFSDLASAAGDQLRRRMFNASFGAGLGTVGFAGLSFVDQKLDGLPAQRIALASYTTNVGDRGAVFGLNAFTSFASREQRGIMGYLSVPLGPVRASAGGGIERGGGTGRFTLERPVPYEGGMGWRVATQEGAVPVRQGEFRLATDRAEYEAGTTMLGEEGVARGRISGSVVALDGLHFRRSVPGSIALVETGVPDVRVLRENRPAGTTDERGRLLLTGLQPYAENRIAIDPLSLPMDATASSTMMGVVPPRNAGVRSRFDVVTGGSALLRLRRPDGQPVAQNASVTNSEGREIGSVGLDGEVFLTDVENAVTVFVADINGSCRVDAKLPRSGARIPVVAGICFATQ